jgi:hypothetical protein
MLERGAVHRPENSAPKSPSEDLRALAERVRDALVDLESVGESDDR